jgi:hypothetical protein
VGNYLQRFLDRRLAVLSGQLRPAHVSVVSRSRRAAEAAEAAAIAAEQQCLPGVSGFVLTPDVEHG